MRTGMRTMVKAMSLLAVLSVTVLLLAACGGKSTAEPTPPAEGAAAPPAGKDDAFRPGAGAASAPLRRTERSPTPYSLLPTPHSLLPTP